MSLSQSFFEESYKDLDKLLTLKSDEIDSDCESLLTNWDDDDTLVMKSTESKNGG
jgi:hypothetical protein